MRRAAHLTTLAMCATLGIACDDDPGAGELVVTAYGEAFIEEGIPASEMGDGWSVSFERFEAEITEVTVAGQAVPDPEPVDLSVSSGGEGHVLASVTAPEGDHTHGSFVIRRVHVVGNATRGDESRTFDWVFEAPTHYVQCETTTRVDAGGTATFEITVHADHFFYDSLVSEEPAVVFDGIAVADTDGDGVITRAELEATDIGAYDPGNADVQDMWQWLVAQSRTLGHVDGEGHCESHPADHTHAE